MRGIFNDKESQLNQIQKKILQKKSSINLDEISNKNILKNVINNEITNDSKIKRKASEHMKNKESIQNNIFQLF